LFGAKAKVQKINGYFEEYTPYKKRRVKQTVEWGIAPARCARVKQGAKKPAQRAKKQVDDEEEELREEMRLREKLRLIRKRRNERKVADEEADDMGMDVDADDPGMEEEVEEDEAEEEEAKEEESEEEEAEDEEAEDEEAEDEEAEDEKGPGFQQCAVVSHNGTAEWASEWRKLCDGVQYFAYVERLDDGSAGQRTLEGLARAHKAMSLATWRRLFAGAEVQPVGAEMDLAAAVDSGRLVR
jgi:hypothetical protein